MSESRLNRCCFVMPILLPNGKYAATPINYIIISVALRRHGRENELVEGYQARPTVSFLKNALLTHSIFVLKLSHFHCKEVNTQTAI